jgi:hypothetical protein
MRIFAIAFLAATVAVACSPGSIAQGADIESGLRLAADETPAAPAPADPPANNCCPMDNCGCAADCTGCCGSCCAGPRVVGTVNWVYLWRNKPDRTDVFYAPNDDVLLNGRDFDLGPRPGIDATLTYYRTCDTGFDLRYLWIDDYSANATFLVPEGENHLNTTPNSYFLSDGEIAASFRYQSKLQSVELNLRREFTFFNLLLGFRYVDLRESLNGVYLSGEDLETETWGQETNNLYGFQAGIEAMLWESAGGDFHIDGFGKAGIYGNSINTHFETRFFESFDDPVTAHANSSKAAFLGELGVTGVYRVSDHFSLRAGYQLLWLSGVATAVRQVPATADFNGEGGRVIESHVDGNSSLFYHGVNVGFEVTW